MSPQHHPREDWLVSYAAGTLDEAHAVVIASHLDYCAACRARVARAEALGGALFEGLTPEPLTSGSLEHILARLDDDRAAPARRDRAPLSRSALPAALDRFLGGRSLDRLPWRFIGPGVRGVRLASDGREDSRLWLLKARGGVSIPTHGHHGSELTLVLQGGYSAAGQSFTAGDLEDADDDVRHSPLIDPGEDCISLVVTEAPIVLEGLAARLLQPLIGL